MKIPEPINSLAQQIYSAYEAMSESSNRPHLGASVIGHPCSRFLWYSFRSAIDKKWPGRMLRLFETGKREESRVHENLRMVGIEVHADDGSSQFKVSKINGHFGGSVDGMITKYYEAPKEWIVLECKTHNASSFKTLVAKGVEEHKPMHYVQCQMYMGMFGVKRALYFAVCKNNDEIYTELLDFDEKIYDLMLERASIIINADEPPPKINNDPSWYQCKNCDYWGICHETDAPQVNCRTCAHSTPVEDGKWSCVLHGNASKTCKDHRYIPVLLENFAKMVDANKEKNWVMYEGNTGNIFTNGVYSSSEIYLCSNKSMLGDEDIDMFRREFGAKVDG